MALTKAQKNKKVAALAADLEKSTSAIIGTFAGLTASKDFALRKTVREAGGSYHVVKNKLAAKSSQGTKVEAALQGLKGVSAVAYTAGDPVALAKALSEWVKDNAEFTFKLGIVDGKVITVQEIGDLAKLPGKEELFSKLLFLIQSPAQRLATVINATGRDLAVVLNQAVEKEKFSAGAKTETAAAYEPAPTASESAPTASEPAPAAAELEPAASVPEPAAADPIATPAPAAESATEQVAEAHAEEAPTPTEQIAQHPASEADPAAEPSGAAQPENVTASQGGEAATTEPVEG